MQDEILALVAARSGMVFAPNRRVEAESGIARAMKRAGEGDRDAYLRRRHGDPGAVDDVMIGEQQSVWGEQNAGARAAV